MNPNDNSYTFKEAFCATFKCRPEVYARAMLFRSFHAHAALIARILYLLNTQSMRRAIEAVDQLGRATSEVEVHMIIDDYRYQLRQIGISSLVRGFRIRLSGRRVLALFDQVELDGRPGTNRQGAALGSSAGRAGIWPPGRTKEPVSMGCSR